LKPIEFKQVNRAKALLLLLAVMLLVFGLPIAAFGLNRVLDFVNNFGSAKGLGLLVGAAVIVPALLLKKYFFSDQCAIEIDKTNITIKANGKLIANVPTQNIAYLEWKDMSTKLLSIYLTDGRKLFEVRPAALKVNEQTDLINKIISAIKEHITLEPVKAQTGKGVFKYDIVKYVKK
jgi:hypothetical protein